MIIVVQVSFHIDSTYCSSSESDEDKEQFLSRQKDSPKTNGLNLVIKRQAGRDVCLPVAAGGFFNYLQVRVHSAEPGPTGSESSCWCSTVWLAERAGPS